MQPLPTDQPAGDTPPRRANRLAESTSPYLLQHAHNPVDWRPWSPEALPVIDLSHRLA